MNATLAEYGARPVALEDTGIATRMNVYRVAADATVDTHEGNEGKHEGGEGDTTTRVLNALKRNPKASIVVLSKELGISRATVERAEKALQAAGRIRRRGGTRGVWEISE